MTSLETLARQLIDRAEGRGRFVFAIAGAPGAGKSTLAEGLLAALERLAPGQAALVPMDGYHFDDVILKARRLLPRKGSPGTFDVDGLAEDLARIRAGGRDVVVPVFDRDLELSRAGARVIPAASRIVLVEGNYLLLDEPPWDGLAPLFDETLFIQVPESELHRRLVARWLGYGLSPETARAKAEGNDLPNASLVAQRSRRADWEWVDNAVRRPSQG